ncbi:MAG: hypothetical protein WA231_21365, partial [Methylocella sp.]
MSEVVSLCKKYGAGTVRRTLAKVTTGRPKKGLGQFDEFWLAVELYRYHKGVSVKIACDGVASFFLLRAKKNKETNRFPYGDRRRHYYRIRKCLREDSFLHLLLKIHCACP